jgi:cytochrome b
MLLATAVVWALYAATRGSDWLSWVLVAGQFILAALAFWEVWRDRHAQQIDQVSRG